MQFPESWLRAFCNPPIDSDALAELLTMSGMEVEASIAAAPPFTHVVVGEVRAVARHPNADRLNVCEVDVGGESMLSIVCGAPNVRPGIKVPCALVGAVLPPAADAKPDAEPFVIKLGQLRGVESQGMLCSARELGLSDDHGGLLVLDADAVVGADIREQLALDDRLLTLKLTPNLAHCLSVYGIARELAALSGALLQPLPCAQIVPRHDDKLPVDLQAPDLCGRFSGRIVRGIDTRAATPGWMVDRLARCGQRSVSALVDISNYVMFECGQPSHIFDLAKITPPLSVRWGRAGETLKLLNGNTVEVDAAVGVVADAEGVESLAGIMGGDATAVSNDTRDIYVEAAFWWPASVAGRSRQFNFATDAGHRFERGVDPALTVPALERITQLIVEICGGSPGPIDDQTVSLPERTPVVLRVARAAKVIGMPLTQTQCEDVLTRLGLPFISVPGTLTVTPPSWRFDLQIEEDLIEEVIRVIGYDQLPDIPPVATLSAHVRSESRRGVDALRHQLADLGYQETINFSFVEERWERELAGNDDPVRLVNPMASQLAVMRSSLVGSLVNTLRSNLSRKASRVRIFEAGRVFRRDASVADGPLDVAGIAQPLRLAGLAFGPVDATQWGVTERNVDFFDAKGDIDALLAPSIADFEPAEHPAMHPGRCARVLIDGQAIGHVGELHPRWRQAWELPSAPVLFELDVAPLLQRQLPRFVPIQRQQSVWRDLSVVAGDAVTHGALMAAIATVGDARLIRSARLFDMYRPSKPVADMRPDERSLSVRLELLDDETPLTETRIDAVVADVLRALHERLGARLRG